MKTSGDNLYDALERIFHEPNRLAIMSALAAAPRGRAFTEIRDECSLTDGNLSRHLKALEEAGAVRIRKAFVAGKPLTTVHLTAWGLERFSEYLAALAKVLRAAQQAVVPEKTTARAGAGLWRPVRA